jgi:hypothetical protein
VQLRLFYRLGVFSFRQCIGLVSFLLEFRRLRQRDDLSAEAERRRKSRRFRAFQRPDVLYRDVGTPLLAKSPVFTGDFCFLDKAMNSG